MRRTSFASKVALILGVALLGVACERFRPAEPSHQQAPAGTTFTCPMHPFIKSDKPGNCPICGMSLVPVAEPGQSTAPTAAGPGGLGMKWAVVERRHASRSLRLPGRVAVDERRIVHVHARVPGFIHQVHVDFVGAPVKAGQPLLEMSSPEILASEQELATALAAARALPSGDYAWASSDARALADAATRRLQLLEVSAGEIARVEAGGEPSDIITIRSPASGIVTMREAFHHSRAVTPDLELFTIVDMSHVWILAQASEADVASIHVGDVADIGLPGDPVLRHAVVTFLAPVVDPSTRTISVRLELDNADARLRPDGFVDVVIPIDLGEVLVVPEEAIVDSGGSQHVFVDSGDGHLLPRSVVAGPLVAGGRAVLDGLDEGERVAASATFLIDSESRLSGVLDSLGAPAHRLRTIGEPTGPAPAPAASGPR